MRKLDKTDLLFNLGQKYKLVPFLDKAMTTFDEPWQFSYTEKGTDDAWHPSGSCTPSVSELYKIAKEYTDTHPPGLTGTSEKVVTKAQTRKAFMVGHYWHQLLQYLVLHKLEFCEHEAIEVKGEKVWSPGKSFGWATGSGDIAPCTTPNWTGVVDFKTMASAQFKQPHVPKWAAVKYECQINIYMDFFDLDHGLIVAINKDTPHDFKEFEYVRNQELIDAIYAKWEFVSECLEHEVEITEADDEEFKLPIGDE